ncbi:DUF4251 domain-containing protein [Pedobacter namyangjuensis]|uniref:DUF4251 domain-containing protein n=1 Tax=Pedobacter namyangjuensis TaxID=600626 RepID=UPI000DE2B796|nr:DUF4251 domain-containing protein [Pedobacter namyangjuensis]
MNELKSLSAVILLAISITANAQTDKATTKRIVDDKNFVFVATSAMPLNATDISNVLNRMPGNMNTGGNINLTGSSYDVRITADSVVSYLPYYGRSFSAPIGRDESGFRFTSKKFSYASKATKKGGWSITINSKDVKDNVRMNLSITQSGYATLNVMSNNKQSISYNGYISEPKAKEEPSK